MAQKFGTNIDLAQNELQNGVIHVLGSDPGTPKTGQIWFRSDLKVLRLRKDGSTTISLVDSALVGGVPEGGTGLNSITDGGIMLGSGTDPVTPTARPTAGQLLIGSTAGDPVLAKLTEVANRTTITSVSGSITIDINALQFPNSGSNEHKVLRGSSSANQATWGTLAIQGGGTGRASLTDGSVLVGDGTNAVQQIALTNGQLLIGSTGSSPSTASLGGDTNRIIITGGAGTIGITLDSTQWPQATGGDAGKALIASGANSTAYGTLSVGGGGTGTTSLTDHGVLLGSGTGSVSVTAVGSAGDVLTGNAGADPTFKSAGGDISGQYSSITVDSVGGRTAATIQDAVDKRHAQNTDVGTTNGSFQIDSGSTGPRIKNESGVMAVRNSADNAYADLVMQDIVVKGNMIVEGVQTIINSNEVSIGDNQITLNEDITDDSQNTNGGIAVTRMSTEITITGAADNGGGLIRITAVGHAMTTGANAFIKNVVGTTEANNIDTNKKWTITRIDDDTFDIVASVFANVYVSGGTVHPRIDAILRWDETGDRWQTRVGAINNPITHNIARTVSFTIGNNSDTQFDLSHNLNTRDTVVQVYRVASPFDTVVTDVERLSTSQVRIRLTVAPTAGQFRVVVTG